jgi:nitronate monooxygenase
MDLLRRRIVVAPMAGGPTTTDLVIAAAGAGALGFLAAGYKTPAVMTAEITAVRAATSEPFGVNVFVPGTPYPDAGRLARYLGSLGPGLGDARWDDDGFDGKIEALLADPPAVTSFTFGCPAAEVIRALQDAGSAVAVTVTTPAEAETAAEAGADALGVQGYEAGAHRGTFVNDDAPGRDRGLLSLIGEVAAVTGLPQIAAGGIMGPRHVQAVLAAGAAAAQCGTVFLRSPESGAHPLHKAALADPRYTATTVTRAGQWVHRRPRGRAARLPRDQQRHPPAAGCGCGQWRYRANVAVGGTGLPPGGRTARRRDHRSAAWMIIIRLASSAGGHTERRCEVEGYLEKGRHASEGCTVR